MSYEPNNLSISINILQAASERQNVIANNIANANTPGYQAKSVSFSDVLDGLNSPFETELSKKMGQSAQSMYASSTGGPVSIQHELIELQKNMVIYNMAARRTSSVFNALRTASQIGR